MMWLSMATSYYTGHRHDFHASGYNSHCVEVTLLPMRDKQINISFGCYGGRASSDVGDDMMMMGIPVELNQLAISSMRVEEMRVLLDNDYYGDAYTEWRFTGGQNWFGIAHKDGIAGLRDEYQTYIKNADLITVDMGWNNFGVYAFNNIKTILSDGKYWKEPDFAQLDGLADKLQYEKLKNIAFEYLKSNVDLADEELNQKLDMMADVLAYAALGACYHFDKSMEII